MLFLNNFFIKQNRFFIFSFVLSFLGLGIILFEIIYLSIKRQPVLLSSEFGSVGLGVMLWFLFLFFLFKEWKKSELEVYLSAIEKEMQDFIKGERNRFDVSANPEWKPMHFEEVIHEKLQSNFDYEKQYLHYSDIVKSEKKKGTDSFHLIEIKQNLDKILNLSNEN